MRRMLFGLSTSAILLAAPACDDHDHEHESPAEDACGHFADGPAASITATDDPGTAPAADALHTRYDVTLADMGGTPGGFLKVAVAEAGEYFFFVDGGATLTLEDSGAAAVTPEASGTTQADCAVVDAWYQFDLEVGTYTVEVAAAAGTTTFSFVRNMADGDHDH
jgi:hypothetical protein